MRTTWGTEEFARLGVPSAAGDSETLRMMAMMERASATPKQAAALYEYFLRYGDIRHVLPTIQIPTLIFHVQNSPLLPIAHGRYLVEHIEGAKLIELPGSDIGGGIPAGAVADIAEFLTGEPSLGEIDRILTTVLFTDIARSTEQLASLGDERWRGILDAHDRTVREQLRRFRGREINTTGDGFVASFDGPARAIRCSEAIVEATSQLGLELRVGLHTGECEVRGEDLGGLAVHIAARVGALASPREVLVSRTVKDLVVGSRDRVRRSRRAQAQGCAGILEPVRRGALTPRAMCLIRYRSTFGRKPPTVGATHIRGYRSRQSRRGTGAVGASVGPSATPDIAPVSSRQPRKR